MTLPCAQLRKIAILVVLIAVVGGCSSTRLIYAFASGFIQDEVAYFLDLDEEVLVQLIALSALIGDFFH